MKCLTLSSLEFFIARMIDCVCLLLTTMISDDRESVYSARGAAECNY